VAKKKGFRPSRVSDGTLTVRFDVGHRLHGLEIEIERRVPIGIVLNANDLTKALPPLIKRIVSWNLTDDDDNPIPPSVEAFGDEFDIEETSAIIGAWQEAMTQPGAPLGPQSAAPSS